MESRDHFTLPEWIGILDTVTKPQPKFLTMDEATRRNHVGWIHGIMHHIQIRIAALDEVVTAALDRRPMAERLQFWMKREKTYEEKTAIADRVYADFLASLGLHDVPPDLDTVLNDCAGFRTCFLLWKEMTDDEELRQLPGVREFLAQIKTRLSQ